MAYVTQPTLQEAFEAGRNWYLNQRPAPQGMNPYNNMGHSRQFWRGYKLENRDCRQAIGHRV